jgi:hypothetical protein
MTPLRKAANPSKKDLAEITEKIVRFAEIVEIDPREVLKLFEDGIITCKPPSAPRDPKLEKLLARVVADPKTRFSQEDFARLLDIAPSTVSRMCARGILPSTASLAVWLASYRSYHQGVAAGRRGSGL